MDSPLLAPYPGLMIWTLITFLLAMAILKKFAFGPIQDLIDKRRQAISEMVDQAERARSESQELLKQYEAQLAAARVESEQIVDRARKAADELTLRVKEEAAEQRREAIADTQRQVRTEIEKAMDDLRGEIADMTVTAVERVTRGALDPASHQQLIEQAVNELDIDRLQKIGGR